MIYDLVVVGAGPAGMKGAIKAREKGASVAIIDENPNQGGKLLGQLHEEPGEGWWIGKNEAATLKERVQQLEIDCFQNNEVWGIYPQWKVMLSNGKELEAKTLLLATGAAEKPIPVPGWTIPGVMAIGAAQVLNNYYRVSPGKKIAIIGLDPLALTVSRELKMAGAHVIGIFIPPISEFAVNHAQPKKMIAYLSNLAHLAPGKHLQLLGKLSQHTFFQHVGAHLYPRHGMKVWGIPLYLRQTVTEIVGAEKVERVKIANIQSDGSLKSKDGESLEADCVCISGGLSPLAELASVAGCAPVYIDDLGGSVPLHNEEMETTQRGVFVAGNITGIEGAKIAMAQGELAGIAISAKLGLIDRSPNQQIADAQENVAHARESTMITFQPYIHRGREKMVQVWKEQHRHG